MKSPLRNWYDAWYRKLWHRHIPKTDVDKLVQRYEGMVVIWHPGYLGHMINSLRNLMVPVLICEPRSTSYIFVWRVASSQAKALKALPCER